MKVIRSHETAPAEGVPFTGEVELERLLPTQRKGGIQIALVRFKEGARTYWHRHPGEQVLYILEGVGRIGSEGADPVQVQAGDVVYAPPGEKHWHGAAAGQNMTHLSITTIGSPEWYDAPE